MASSFVLVHIVTKLELGGAQLATLHQVEHIDFGVRPHHLIYGPGGMLDEAAQGMRGVRCWPVQALTGPLSPMRDVRGVLAIAKILRQIQQAHLGCALVVHTHSSKAGILGRWAARLVGACCVVHTIHGFGHQRHMHSSLFAALWAAERMTALITTGFTADSQANLDRGHKEHLLGGKPKCVVRCGIDLTAYTPGLASPELRASFDIEAEDAVVLTVACLKPQKDPLTWVKVAAHVVAERPRTVFLLAGDGVMRPAVTKAIQAAKLEHHCRLLGWRHDIPQLMQLSDVVLHTSLWEGLPQVFAQAMACARPVVATCVDGAPEAIEAGVTGLLRPAQDAAGLATDVAALLVDPALAQAMGKRGLAHVQRFSQARMLLDLSAFYAQLMRTKGPVGL